MVEIKVGLRDDGPQINRMLYGQFAEHLGRCIYEGVWVGEDSAIPNTRGIRNDVVKALKELKVPVIRWPGGCFADEYHWKDGIGPRKDRPSMYNSHWGGVVENNHFGTHEFFDLCEQVGCATYVCGNVGSGTVREMSEWVEYMTSPAQSPMADLRRKHGRDEPWKLDYFGVGNESWGCGGHMRPEYYADEYRRYNTYVRTYGPNKIQRVACGPNTADFRWTEVLMDQARHHMDALALHYYTLLNQKWPPSGQATDFGEADYLSTLNAAAHMEELIEKHSAIMDKSDPEKRVNLAVDEWGTWHASEPGSKPGFLYQQNAVRDMVVAAMHFDMFHRHCERIRLANIAQMVNVLQAMILTDKEKMIKTPTYWAFWLYRDHMDAMRADVEIVADDLSETVKAVSATASSKDGRKTVSMSCLDHKAGRTVKVSGVSGQVLSAFVATGPAMQAHNTFDDPDVVKPLELAVKGVSGGFEVALPPMSVATITLG